MNYPFLLSLPIVTEWANESGKAQYMEGKEMKAIVVGNKLVVNTI